MSSTPVVNSPEVEVLPLAVATSIKLPTKYESYETEALPAFNQTFCYIISANVIIRLSDGAVYSPDTFIRYQYVNWLFKERDKDGNITYTSVAGKWFRDSRRKQKDRMDYVPGKGKWEVSNVLNRWTGWGSIPVRGDISPWNKLLGFLFRGGPSERRYFEQWLAYPIQHPGAKLMTAVVLRSLIQGVGKDSVAEVMMQVYGRNAIMIKSQDLYKQFNSWQLDKQFIVGSEVQGTRDSRNVVEQLKMIITSPTVMVEQKYKDAFSAANYANYLFLTNNPDPFYIADQDRRFWAWEIPEGTIGEDEDECRKFYDEFHKWSASTDGVAALHHHLLHLDLTGFDPHAPAPMTELKREMIELNRSDVERWLRELPDDQPDRFLYTPNELEILWAKHCVARGKNVTKADSSAIPRAMKHLGFKQADTGKASKQIKLAKKAVRLWIIAASEKIAELRLHDVKESNVWRKLYEDQPRSFNE